MRISASPFLLSWVSLSFSESKTLGSYSQNAEAVTLNFDRFFFVFVLFLLSRRPSVLSESHQAEVGTAEFNLCVCVDSLFPLFYRRNLGGERRPWRGECGPMGGTWCLSTWSLQRELYCWDNCGSLTQSRISWLILRKHSLFQLTFQ